MSDRLVGREEELQALELFLLRAREMPHALVIEGEAGIGKTSLWNAGVASARAGGATTLCARPAQTEASFAYAALGDLLRGERDALATIPERRRRALEAALTPESGAAAPDPRVLALAVLGIVERLAGRAPVVVAVDDVQWLDAPSASALGFALRRLEA